MGQYAYAQLQEYSRFEQKIPRKLDYTFEILPLLQEKKIILFGEKENSDEDTRRRVYYFKILDSSLAQIKEKEYKIERKWLYEGYHTDSTNLYLLFYADNHRRFALLSYNVAGELDFRQGEIPFTFTPSSFVVFGNNVFLVGTNKGKDVIVDFSFFDNSVKIVPTYFDDKYDVKNIAINRNENIAHILIRETKRGTKNFFIRQMLSNGKQVGETKLIFDKEKYPTDLEMFSINDENYLLGLYGNGQSHFYSQGWIWGKYKAQEKPYLKFESFDYLKHFFEYMPNEKRKEKEEEKVKAKLEKGKHYSYKLRIRLHKPIVQDKQVLLIAESYNAAYQYNNSLLTPYPFMSTNSMMLPPADRWRGGYYRYNYGSPPPTYHFVHCIVIALDLQGNLLWDNAMKIKNITKTSLYENVTLSLQKDRCILLQPHDKGINMRVFRQREVIYENEEVPYQKKYEINPEKENRIRSTSSQTFAWFNDYLLIAGIYNPKADKFFSREEDVFYIAKVKFQEPEKK
ncbi:MAG: hypothetical protein OHK0045_10140 [Raineya sp.]